ncbi:MAG: 16S rRNA (uracil(1498)-N(3))-methyltransferase [Candidatus Latescibacteria bacterium]|nr:16S rRNA (uracil(1498)-N(3))-methyltransferase [Candidatus Latescibacterota bacterium]
MQNFYVEDINAASGYITLTGDEYMHATRSSRVRVGEKIGVTDGRGCRVVARIESIDHQKLAAAIEQDVSGQGEPPVIISGGLALIKPARFESAVEQCAELGVRQMIPVITERCLVKPERINIPRIQRIAREAAKQSGRSWIPEISQPVELHEFLQTSDNPIFVAHKDAIMSLPDVLKNVMPCYALTLIIGPEGDFTDDEIGFMKSHSVIPFSLGGLTLRSETAIVAATAVVVAVVSK